MRHFFIINPTAGKGKENLKWLDRIQAFSQAHHGRWNIQTHVTNGVGNATQFIRTTMEADASPARFYACGGDGTLGEVVNGAYGFPQAQVGMVPLGTGNDFPRNFTNPNSFWNIESQLSGTPRQLDLLRIKDATTGLDLYCINMVNIGFDCSVVERMANAKTSLLWGSFAYYKSILIQFFQPLGVNLSFFLEDGEALHGRHLLVSAANGSYCGGGFKAAPYGNMDNGLMEIGIVKAVSRMRILQLIGLYKKGTHMESKHGPQVVTYRQAKSLRITAPVPTSICVDGEIFTMEDLELSVLKQAISFVIPRGAGIHQNPIYPGKL
ncbi:YegS/Rv2252/BmrU family lipid kinase [Eubacteriales bacterium OttesenSCG-928-M02]|nr:YegS/Rv2252/BmrU family lipid kinase [Eubacteriales bacterium OttesenSCG-928-M02]